MAELAIKPMTLDEFLRWDDGTETHYELIGGSPVAMTPPAEAHRILAVRLVTRIDAALAGQRPCNAQVEAVADTTRDANVARYTVGKVTAVRYPSVPNHASVGAMTGQVTDPLNGIESPAKARKASTNWEIGWLRTNGWIQWGNCSAG